MQSKEGNARLGVGLMRRVGPQPPEPDWDRLDMRGVNGTRQAWGYIDPEDNIIVTNDGRVFIKVERGNIEMTKGNHPLIRLPKHFSSLIRRTFRWVKIIRKMFEFVDEVPDSTEQTPEKTQKSIEEKRLRMKR